MSVFFSTFYVSQRGKSVGELFTALYIFIDALNKDNKAKVNFDLKVLIKIRKERIICKIQFIYVYEILDV